MFVDSSSDNGDDDNIFDHECGVLCACGHRRTLQILMSHSHNKICESSIWKRKMLEQRNREVEECVSVP